MSKQENTRRFQITEGPTVLSMGDNGLFLQQGGNAIAFSNIEDFMEFVNRIGIVAVRLDQEMQNLAARAQTRHDDEETPT